MRLIQLHRHGNEAPLAVSAKIKITKFTQFEKQSLENVVILVPEAFENFYSDCADRALPGFHSCD